jgi:hypothetical protein
LEIIIRKEIYPKTRWYDLNSLKSSFVFVFIFLNLFLFLRYPEENFHLLN